MYLEKFRIINFRAIEDITLNFNPGLNVLIGENNTGKTSIIDALRLCLGFGDQKRSIFVNKSDFRIDKNLKICYYLIMHASKTKWQTRLP